jgi:glycosyltransferase involved in cell wall biosynthesis
MCKAQTALPSAGSVTIGMDARAATEVRAGRGRVVRELLRALNAREDSDRYVLYARERWQKGFDARFTWRLSWAPDPLWHASAARDANRSCDVFLSSNSYLTTALLRIPAVPIVYDLTTFEPSMHPNHRSTLIERLTLRQAVRRSSSLIAISRATADALIERFPTAEGRTVVAPLGVARSLSPDLRPDVLAGLPAPGFVLAVGTLEPRKNLPRLVAAYSSLADELQARHRLVVVGAHGWGTGPTVKSLEALGERCTLLGHVTDAVLAELYRRCAVFCYPSLGEGFGLPVLEAMAAGAAVVTSNLSSLPEVGGDAVEYVDPHDVASIATGLRQLLTDHNRRAELGRRAELRAREFSWERFADTVHATLKRAARG